MTDLDLLVEYLVENNLAPSYEDALNIIPAMSDAWMASILEEFSTEDSDLFDFIMEMRKEDKVKGKGKTPLNIEVRSNKLQKVDGKWGRPTRTMMNPDAYTGRYNQGTLAINKGFLPKDIRPNPHGENGRLRGVKKKRGAKSEIGEFDRSPAVQGYLRKKARKAEREVMSKSANKFSSGY